MRTKFVIFGVVLLEIVYLIYAQNQAPTPTLSPEKASSSIGIEQIYVHPYDVTHEVKDALNSLSNQDKYLNISSLKLQYIPSFVVKSKKRIEGINLSTNKIRRFPTELSHREELIQLNLSLNYLLEMPSSIEEFESLEVLNLAENQLTNLPIEITKLKKLRSLNVDWNPIKTLPNLSKCKDLRHLSVRGTGISREELGALKRQMPNLHLVSDFY